MGLSLLAAGGRHAAGLVSPGDTSLIRLTCPDALAHDVVNREGKSLCVLIKSRSLLGYAVRMIKVGNYCSKHMPSTSAQSVQIFQAIYLGACRCHNTHRLTTFLNSEANGGFLAFTFATASDMAVEMALVAVANA